MKNNPAAARDVEARLRELAGVPARGERKAEVKDDKPVPRSEEKRAHK